MNLNCPILKNKTTIKKQLRTSLLFDKISNLREIDFYTSTAEELFSDLIKADVEFNYDNLRIEFSDTLYYSTGVTGFAREDGQCFVIDKMRQYNNFEFRKCMILLTCFHELTHIKQLYQLDGKSDYLKFIALEDYGLKAKIKPNYDLSLLELDARYNSVRRFFNELTNKNIKESPDAWLTLAFESFYYFVTTMALSFEDLRKSTDKVNYDCSNLITEFKRYNAEIYTKSKYKSDIDFDKLKQHINNQISEMRDIFKISCKNMAIQFKNYEFISSLSHINYKELYNANLSIKDFAIMFSKIIFSIYNSSILDKEVENAEQLEEILQGDR